MKSRHLVGTALVVAIPLELVNFFIFPFPIDVGLSDNASWFRQVMGFQWVILHWPGLRLLQWLGRIGQMRLGTVALIASGYADTALLLIAAFLAFRGIRRLAQRMAPSQGERSRPGISS